MATPVNNALSLEEKFNMNTKRMPRSAKSTLYLHVSFIDANIQFQILLLIFFIKRIVRRIIENIGLYHQ